VARRSGATVGRPSLIDVASPSVEVIRALRLALVLKGGGTTGSNVVITSAEPGAGKSTIAANLALVSAGLTTPEQFNAKLASHVTNYRKLQTPLDAPGTHKGPPLYGGGALVAFTWDTMIHESTQNARGLGDVMRALLRDTKKPYAWSDIEAALTSVAPGDWEGFHRRYISGTEPLPLSEALARVGLVLSQSGDGSARVTPDPAAPEAAKARRRAMTGSPSKRGSP